MIKKHLEVKTYNYGDIGVMVLINYDKREISLIEREWQNIRPSTDTFPVKKWVFANRTLEYMNGWLNILEAMKTAIEAAQEELENYLKAIQKEKEEDVTAVLMEATDIVKNKKYGGKNSKKRK